MLWIDELITSLTINLAVNLMFCLLRIMIYPYNKNQKDALFTFNLFEKLTSI